MRRSSVATKFSKATTRSAQTHAAFHVFTIDPCGAAAGKLAWLPDAAWKLADAAASDWTLAAPA